MGTATASRERERTLIVAPFEYKAEAVDEEARTFEGFLSTSHLDEGDGWMQDIVHPGAFKRWINSFAALPEEKRDVPLLDSHNWRSIFAALGQLIDVKEELTGDVLEYELAEPDAKGETLLRVPEMRLWTKWSIEEGTDGDRVLSRLRSRVVRKMSMGYAPLEFDFGTLASGNRVRHLRELKVREGSLVIFPMNPNAEIDLETVKEAVSRIEVRTGTRLSDEEKEELEGIREKIDNLLSTSAKDDEGGESEEETEATPRSEDDPESDAPPPEEEEPEEFDVEKALALRARIQRLTIGRRIESLQAHTE